MPTRTADAGLLEAALEAIDAWDQCQGAADEAPDASPSKGGEGRDPDGDGPSTRHQELQYLLRRVEMLQQQQRDQDRGEPPRDLEQDQQQQRQRQQRLRAAQGLMRVLRKSRPRRERTESAEDDGESAKRIRLERATLDEHEDARRAPGDVCRPPVDEQLARVETLYAQTDAVFSHRRFARDRGGGGGAGPVTFQDVDVLHDHDGGAVVYIRTSWAVPFALANVVDALWMHLVKYTEDRGNCNLGQSVVERGNTVTSAFSGFDPRDGAASACDGQMVAKCFRDHAANEAVIVSTAVSAPRVGAAPSSWDGYSLHENAWHRLRPLSATTTTTAAVTASTSAPMDTIGRRQKLTLIETSRQLHLRVVRNSGDAPHAKVGVLTEWLLQEVDDEHQWRRQMIESLLRLRV